jgi:hypothetical protein
MTVAAIPIAITLNRIDFVVRRMNLRVHLALKKCVRVQGVMSLLPTRTSAVCLGYHLLSTAPVDMTARRHIPCGIHLKGSGLEVSDSAVVRASRFTLAGRASCGTKSWSTNPHQERRPWAGML